jgi:hypothetical protein
LNHQNKNPKSSPNSYATSGGESAMSLTDRGSESELMSDGNVDNDIEDDPTSMGINALEITSNSDADTPKISSWLNDNAGSRKFPKKSILNLPKVF